VILPKFLYPPFPSVALALVDAGLAVTLISLSVIDLRSFRLFDTLTIPLIVSGVVFAAISGSDQLFARSVAALLGFLVLYFTRELYVRCRGHHGLGLGDAKLFAASGAWTGLAGLPWVMLLACATALVVVYLLKARGAAISSKSALPFGPFLAIGFWVVWLNGSQA
jgi:leader peptidase (prepilin peptidase)/N-methyltransferase